MIVAGTARHTFRRNVSNDLFRAKQVNIEDQGGIWRDDSTGARRPIAQRWRNCQLGVTSDRQEGDTFIPSSNNLACAKFKCKWRASIA